MKFIGCLIAGLVLCPVLCSASAFGASLEPTYAKNGLLTSRSAFTFGVGVEIKPKDRSAADGLSPSTIALSFSRGAGKVCKGFLKRWLGHDIVGANSILIQDRVISWIKNQRGERAAVGY